MAGKEERSLEIKFCRIELGGFAPSRSDSGSLYDIYAIERTRVRLGEVQKVRTGLVLEIPPGHFGLLLARSSLAQVHRLSLPCGVIDSTYRGEISVVVQNHSYRDYTVLPGDRVAQLVVLPLPQLQWVEVSGTERLSTTERGAGGFGSTGR